MIYISSSALKSEFIETCIKELASAGIRNIELSGGTKYSGDSVSALITLKDEYSLNYLIHNYFPPPRESFILNIASQNEEIRKKSVRFIKSSIEIAGQLNIDRYSVHAGYTMHLDPGPGGGFFIGDRSQTTTSDAAQKLMFESLWEINEHAARSNVRIGLENLFPLADSHQCSLLCTPSDIFRFLDSITEIDNIGLLLDLGHLMVSSHYLDFNKDDCTDKLSKKYHQKILGIHLSGNDGTFDQHKPLSHDSWQLKAASRFDLDSIPVTLESRGLTIDEVLSQYQMIKSLLGIKHPAF